MTFGGKGHQMIVSLPCDCGVEITKLPQVSKQWPMKQRFSCWKQTCPYLRDNKMHDNKRVMIISGLSCCGMVCCVSKYDVWHFKENQIENWIKCTLRMCCTETPWSKQHPDTCSYTSPIVLITTIISVMHSLGHQILAVVFMGISLTTVAPTVEGTIILMSGIIMMSATSCYALIIIQ